MFSRKRCSYALTGKDVTPTNPKSTYSYSYGDADWGDKLTAYRGQSITYDEIGNPLNDGTWTYTWQQGRQLATMSSGNITWTYTYDANGMRTSRTSNGTTAYTYVYNGTQLSMMTYNGNVLYFAYDAAGRPMTVNYNGNTYYYVTNLQGDVLAILNELGQMMVNYTYDAWGRSLGTGGALANSLGLYNPLRYRGYVYDQETGLYYLQSRYYNPEIGRFISADNYPSTGQGLTGNNMFAYCGNNPVSRGDEGGEFWNIVIGAAVGAVVSAATTAIQSYVETGSVDVGKTIISGLVGAASGAIAATGLGMITQAAITAGVAFAGDVATQMICEDKSWNEVNKLKAVHNGLLAGATSVIGSVLGGITSSGHAIKGETLVSAGKDKLLTGYVRQVSGQSYSKLINQGRNLIAAGTKSINIGRGISSVIGTLLTWGVAQKYSWS